MKSIVSSIKKYLSCCLNCGSFVVAEASLCRPCLDCVRLSYQSQAEPLGPIQVRALFEWRAGDSDLLSRVILTTKKNRLVEVWQYYADQFALRWAKDVIEFNQNLILVPSPARQAHLKDHAYLWAEALGKAWGAQVYPCLERVTSHSQRNGDRGDRALVEMQIRENSTGSMDFPPHSRWIFIDDVLTTGATAREAYRALGAPSHFEVWVLARRTLPCGASKSLL